MKFTDGFWQLRDGVELLCAAQARTIEHGQGRLVVTAPTRVIQTRGDTLNRPTLTVTLTSPAEGVVGVLLEHHRGRAPRRGLALPGVGPDTGTVVVDERGDAELRSGDLVARVRHGAPWSLEFHSRGRRLTGSGPRSQAYVRVAPGARVEAGPHGAARERESRYVREQLDLGVGELVYGLGERFGPLVKNGQSVEIWNADGGTSSEQAYKNVPFHLSSRGYGVLVDDAGHVSYEVGSEAVERVQFSVEGERLQYYVIDGPTPKDVLRRYTALSGRPSAVPAWSYGLWLSTSFTPDYDEATVHGFIDGMAERSIPLSVFHFDCFWMRELRWCDFEWDPETFPDPEGLLSRLHERDLRVSLWINPYVAQLSPLFEEAREAGYLLRGTEGHVWQWDMWQAGMALVDFTNPDAVRWYQAHLRRLLRQGVDCFKTDFGERVPLDVVWFDGSDPQAMRNRYTHLYNQAVFEVLREERGAGEAVLFARSATAGGQQMPVHWGGDSTSSYASMAETLRGGLSLAACGFGFWSHDIGGFEGTPDATVFKRWVAFGLLGSHSRLHGSESYRVPWSFDEPADVGTPTSAVAVTRRFVELKMTLMPTLYAAGLEAAACGTPVMRPMVLEFPDDPAVGHLDRQYMLGADLLVAPVLSADGEVDLYLPEGEWTSWWTGRTVTGGRWVREQHDVDTVPLYLRPGAVLALSDRVDRPDHPYLESLTLRVAPGPDGERRVVVTEPGGRGGVVTVTRAGRRVTARSEEVAGFTLDVVGVARVASRDGLAVVDGAAS